MSKKVLFLPGILGSELWERGPIPVLSPDRKIWLDPLQLLGGALVRLQLAPDGLSAGPFAGGASIFPRSPLSQFYGPLGTWLVASGYDLLWAGYDWRLSILTVAGRAWPVVRAWLAGQPLYIVAHSQGGLLARALYGQMLAAGAADQLALMVTMATPHYGSWEAARAWWHAARLYRFLLATCERWAHPLQGALVAYIDLVLASWPALYTLMPWRFSGPLQQNYPDQAALIYDPAYYRPPASAWVSPARLAAAPLEQSLLQQWLPVANMVGIYGTGHKTPDHLVPGGNPSLASGYVYTADGDGTVTLAQGAVPGMTRYTLGLTHELFGLAGDVWQLVSSLLGPA